MSARTLPGHGMAIALLLSGLAACRSSDDPAPAQADGDADTDTDADTDVDTEDTREPVDSGNVRVQLAEAEAIDPSELVLAWTGVRVACEGGQASIVGEFIGPVGEARVTPIAAGVPGDELGADIDEGTVFRTATVAAAVDDCASTAWRLVVTNDDQQSCIVAGPGASDWLASSGEDCELR